MQVAVAIAAQHYAAKHGGANTFLFRWWSRYFGLLDVRRPPLAEAARCALDLQLELSYLDLHSLHLPASLGLRLGLDAGAVFEVRDPILKSAAFTGSHINRTARLEPNTPPGEVYVTEAFAALVTLVEHRDLACEYVGMMKTPKSYGRLRTYLLRPCANGGLDRQIGIVGR
jgi:class 3 adenylate cyclase